MAKETGSIESRASDRRTTTSEYTSPARELLNSALSLIAVIGITLVSGVILNHFLDRKPV